MWSPWVRVPAVVNSLVPADAKNWLKRLRKVVAPKRLRFFLVGEYGDGSERPHYHAAIFGLPQCFNGRTNHYIKRCCSICEVVKESWGKGRIDVGELNEESAGYIAGYVTKKWTKEDSWNQEKLKGRHPEFVRMSNGGSQKTGGIGAPAIKGFVSFGEQSQRTKKIFKSCIDAPAVLRKNGRLFPLGRYLRKVWREGLGRSPDTPELLMGQFVEEMYGVRAGLQEQAKARGAPSIFADAREAHFAANGEKIKSLEKRFKIYQTRRPL